MEAEELIEILDRMTNIFRELAKNFNQLDNAVEKKDIEGINKIVNKIKDTTKDLNNLEIERMKLTKSLCEKYKIQESARALAVELKNPELTQALNLLIESINDLLIKRDYTMNILKTHIDYLNFSIDYFKKLLSFGNYDEKGKTSKYINLLDKEG